MKLRVNHIGGISHFGHHEMQINCMMTEGQMLNAILTFLEHVPGQRWEEWKALIDANVYPAPKNAPKRA